MNEANLLESLQKLGNTAKSLLFGFIKEHAEIETQSIQFLESACDHIIPGVVGLFEEEFKRQGKTLKNDLFFSVKLLTKKNDADYSIVTAYRNKKAREVREVLVKDYSIEGNTDFREIILGDKPFFLCNDLKNLNGYKNESSDWEERYNATVVVPISSNDRQHDADDNILYGMLTVDNLNSEHESDLFNANHRLILQYAADLMAVIFLFVDLNQAVNTSEAVA